MSLLGGECHMIGWIIVIVIAVVAVGYYMYVSDERKKRNRQKEIMRQRARTQQRTRMQQEANRTPRRTQTIRTTPISERSETGPMIYFANDRHGSTDKEYRFNYKKVDGGYRAYILKMPDLRGRDGKSIPTHRLWDENNKPYICWNQKVTSLKDIQTISKVWADSIQEYIATGKRFGPE